MRQSIMQMIAAAALAVGLVFCANAKADEAIDPALIMKFNLLSKNGNSSCSTSFQKSIPNMSTISSLQGSCCSEMTFNRYSEQIAGLKKYASITDIPPDPYDLPAGLAAKLLASDELALSPSEQQAYDYAMTHSEEKGPCCCQCWRWHVYGGLAKLLIHEHGFTGEQITEVWNLSDGCGGDK